MFSCNPPFSYAHINHYLKQACQIKSSNIIVIHECREGNWAESAQGGRECVNRPVPFPCPCPFPFTGYEHQWGEGHGSMLPRVFSLQKVGDTPSLLQRSAVWGRGCRPQFPRSRVALRWIPNGGPSVKIGTSQRKIPNSSSVNQWGAGHQVQLPPHFSAQGRSLRGVGQQAPLPPDPLQQNRFIFTSPQWSSPPI